MKREEHRATDGRATYETNLAKTPHTFLEPAGDVDEDERKREGKKSKKSLAEAKFVETTNPAVEDVVLVRGPYGV